MARTVKRRDAYRVLVGRPEEKRPPENLGVDGRIILKWIFKKYNGGVEWITVAQDKEQWRVFVNTVMNLGVPQNEGNLLTGQETVSFSRRTMPHALSTANT
jgi:hypothetical protein